jgi:hypothetical protein
MPPHWPRHTNKNPPSSFASSVSSGRRPLWELEPVNFVVGRRTSAGELAERPGRRKLARLILVSAYTHQWTGLPRCVPLRNRTSQACLIDCHS